MFKQYHLYREKMTKGLKLLRISTSKGNAITEYALVALLVIAVSIPAFQLLGSGFDSAMAMVRQDIKSKSQATTAAIAAQKAAAIASAATPQLGASAQAILEESLQSKLQTTGANGSTEVLAQQIAATAAALLSQGKIDQNQFDILMRLSNQGHKMAQIQGYISEALSRANGNLAALNSMSFTIDGQKYNVEQLSKLIGFDGPYPAMLAGSNVLNQPVGGTTGGDVGTFLSLYNEAVASGALSDPLANSTVVSAATQIASLGEIVEDVVYNVEHNGMPGDTQNINTLTSDTATALSSGSICTAGDFQDNGVLCSP